MRLAYLDEAGISNLDQEPYLVVAGVILNGDRDWQKIERYLRELIRKYLPMHPNAHMIFHAKDIWHGSKQFRRDIWSLKVRMALLEDLASIPIKFDLPIVFGAIHRQTLKDLLSRVPNMPSRSIGIVTHAEAYMQSIAEIDIWMRKNAREEVAMVVAEDTSVVKTALKMIHLCMSQDGEVSKTDDKFNTVSTNYIIDTVHFAVKAESAPLQVADTCAFIIKRQLMAKPGMTRLFDLLRPQLVSPPHNGILHVPSGIHLQIVKLKVLRNDNEELP